MSKRLCSTCGTTHLPPTGRHCELANDVPLPPEEEDEMESPEEKMAKLKSQIQEQELVLENTASILELEKRLADLKLQQQKMQEGRYMLAKTIARAKYPSQMDKKPHVKEHGVVKESEFTSPPGHAAPGHGLQATHGEHIQSGSTGFAMPCNTSSEGSRDSDNSVESNHRKKLL